MEDEKLDNAAFYPNSSAVPREIDKVAAANHSIELEHHVDSCSSERSMDRNQNAATLNEGAGGNKRFGSELAYHSNDTPFRSSQDDKSRDGRPTKSRSIEGSIESDSDNRPNSIDENSAELRPNTSEVNKNGQANDRTANQEANGLTSEPTIMSNGRLKRNDDQLNETSSEDSSSIKRICNNSTKTTQVNSFFAANSNGEPGSSSNSADSSSSSCTLKEPIKNGESLSDDNTETESNSDRFESDDDLTEEENTWDCSVCTYRNSSDAFKCQMCDVRKNFSSRKPRINPKLLVQQVAKQQQQIQQEALRASALQKSSSSKSVEKCPSNKDRSKVNSSSLTNSLEKRKTVDLEPMSPTSSTSSSKSVKREKKESASPHKEENGMNAKSSFTFRLKDVDRTNGVTKSITVGNVTVKITEFQLKRPEGDPLKKNGKKSTPNKNKFPGS